MNALGEALGPGCNAQMNTLIDQDHCDRLCGILLSESEVVKLDNKLSLGKSGSGSRYW